MTHLLKDCSRHAVKESSIRSISLDVDVMLHIAEISKLLQVAKLAASFYVQACCPELQRQLMDFSHAVGDQKRSSNMVLAAGSVNKKKAQKKFSALASASGEGRDK